MDEKKKQKAPIGIRPTDYCDMVFRDMAKKRGLTLTQLFEDLVRKERKEQVDALKPQGLDCALEVQMADIATKNLMASINQILTKANVGLASKNKELDRIKEQADKEISIANAELTTKVKELEADKLQLTAELEKNTDDANLNKLRNQTLHCEKETLKEDISIKDERISTLEKELKERDKAIKLLDKEMNVAIGDIDNVKKEVTLLKNEKKSLEGKLTSSQADNYALQQTLNTLNTIKKTEVDAIKDNAETMFNLRLDAIETKKNIEIDKLQATIESLKEQLELKNVEINEYDKLIKKTKGKVKNEK